MNNTNTIKHYPELKLVHKEPGFMNWHSSDGQRAFEAKRIVSYWRVTEKTLDGVNPTRLGSGKFPTLCDLRLHLQRQGFRFPVSKRRKKSGK